jgi:hypothetical protein
MRFFTDSAPTPRSKPSLTAASDQYAVAPDDEAHASFARLGDVNGELAQPQ